MSSLRFWPITASTLPSLALSSTLARVVVEAARPRPARACRRRRRACAASACDALSSRRASAMSASISGRMPGAGLRVDRLRGLVGGGDARWSTAACTFA